MNLGANLASTDTIINLSNNGVQQMAIQQPLPLLILLRRTSDGAVEVVRLVNQISGSTGTIVRGQMGSVPLAFTTADTADLLPSKPINSVKTYPAGSPALGLTNTVLAATGLTGSPQNITVGITNPDIPRSITATGNAGGITGNVVVHGTDFGGNSIAETIALSGSSTVNGNKAFATISEIDLPVQTHVGTDTVKVGLGAKIGLTEVTTRDTVVKAFLNGVPETLGSWSVAFGTGLSDCTVTLASALNGTPVIIDFYSS